MLKRLAQVPAGTATNFTFMASTRRRGARRLLQNTNITVMPADRSAVLAGATLAPSCPAVQTCDLAATIAAFVPDGGPSVVHAECLAVKMIRQAATVLAASLLNDTAYKVIVVTTDLAHHQAAWMAQVHTQDLTPPQLQLIEAPAPGFTAFQVVLALDEPGTIHAWLSLAGQAGVDPAAQPTCPPGVKVRVSRAPLLSQGREPWAWTA